MTKVFKVGWPSGYGEYILSKMSISALFKGTPCFPDIIQHFKTGMNSKTDTREQMF